MLFNLKLLAIDGNSILNRAFYGVRPLTAKDGTPTNAIFGFLNILLKLERVVSPDAVAVAFDVSRKSFRNEQFAEYKANRKGMPDDLRAQLPIVKDILTMLGYSILGVEGYEGDDILGTLAKASSASLNECVVATGDRDCLQLIDDHVSVLLVKTKEDVLYNSENARENIGINPKQVIDLKALMGDSSDNIPGVKGIGEKTALALIQKYHSIDEIYKDVDAIDSTPRVKKLLSEGRDSAYMSYKLATICCEAPVDTDIMTYVKKQADTERLRELLMRLDMFSFLDKLNIGQGENVMPAEHTQQERLEVHEDVDIDAIARLAADSSQDTFCVLLKAEDDLQLNVADSIYTVCQNVDEAIDIIAKSEVKLVTFMAKPLIKRIKQLGYFDVKLCFDAELAGYLLNPDSKGYTIEILSQKYLRGMNMTLSEEQQKYFDIAYLPHLYRCFLKLLDDEGMLTLYNTIELPLCEVLADMETEGFAVDVEGVEEFGAKLQTNIDIVKQQIYELAGEEFNINSTKELGVILFERLGLPAKKKTKTGYSTNAEVLESLMKYHDIIPAILEYRQLAKLHSTYVVGLLKVVGEDKRVHSTFNQTETRTGRISSTEPNVQNIPVRTPLGSEIRKFFIAHEGYTLIDADYSQIELRILAHIAQDKNMIAAFINKDDIHAITASQVFDCPLEQMTSTLRSRAKAINFGIVYGIGAYSLSQDINVSVAEAKEYIEAYLRTYNGVSDYMHRIIEQAQRDGYVTTLYGRKRDLSDINASNKMVKAFAQRVALNTPIQGTAADIIKLAMIRIHSRIKKEGLDARLILQVHDELIIEAPTIQAQMVKSMLKEEMENAAQLLVPLVVDVNTGRDWYTSKG